MKIFEDLLRDLCVSRTQMMKWMEESGLTLRTLKSQEKGSRLGDLSSDGEALLRNIHLSHTHPEVRTRIKNMTKVIVDQREEIADLQRQIDLLTGNLQKQIRSLTKKGEP